jgi:hypothetical protein
MNNQTKIKRGFLAGVLALTLLLGILKATGNVLASNIPTHAATTQGTCWKCN